MERQAFLEQLNTAIEELQKAVKGYEAYIPEAAGTVNAVSEEAQLFTLFEAYLMADKAHNDAQAEFTRVTGKSYTSGYESRPLHLRNEIKVPVDKTAALSLSEIRQAEADAEKEWERGHEAALVVLATRQPLDIVKKQLHDTMPHYVWIKYPARNLVFGIDTGTWGG